MFLNFTLNNFVRGDGANTNFSNTAATIGIPDIQWLFDRI